MKTPWECETERGAYYIGHEAKVPPGPYCVDPRRVIPADPLEVGTFYADEVDRRVEVLWSSPMFTLVRPTWNDELPPELLSTRRARTNFPTRCEAR